MGLLEAIIIAIVEGLTEFLPISSTGHMIITSSLLGVEQNDFNKLFAISIQLGAIMAVVILYWRKFFKFTQWEFYAKLAVGVIPALVMGYLFNEQIGSLLESELVVAIMLLLGGIILLYIDKWFDQPINKGEPDLFATEVTKKELIESDEKLTYKKAFVVGYFQVLAMIPGVSRSAASIIGGMQQRLSRNFAAEFSFFLAVPTMFAASMYYLFLKKWEQGTAEVYGYEIILESEANIQAFVAGNVVAFVVAILAIKFFINFLKKYGFRVFGIYRIVVGIILLGLIAAGYL